MSTTTTVKTRLTAAPRSIPVTGATLSSAAKVTRLETSGSTLGLTIEFKALSDSSCPGSIPSPPDVWWYEAVKEWANENKVQMQHLTPAIDSTMKSLSKYDSSRSSQDFPKPITTVDGTSLFGPTNLASERNVWALDRRGPRDSSGSQMYAEGADEGAKTGGTFSSSTRRTKTRTQSLWMGRAQRTRVIPHCLGEISALHLYDTPWILVPDMYLSSMSLSYA